MKASDATAHPTAKMLRALQDLIAFIEEGWEYPDAHHKAAVRNGVCAAELQDRYDQYCIDEQVTYIRFN